MVVETVEVEKYFERFKGVCPIASIIQFQKMFRSLYGKLYQRLHGDHEEVLEDAYNQMVKWYEEGDAEVTEQLAVNIAAGSEEQAWCRVMRLLNEKGKMK